MHYQNLPQNIAAESDSQELVVANSNEAQSTEAEEDAQLGDNLTWSQIRNGYKDYRERAASARAAAKAVGR